MIITARQSGGVTILDLNGTLTVNNSGKLPTAVWDHLNNGGRNILLNMAKVSQYDSIALNELLACFERTKQKGGKLKLCNRTNAMSLVLASQLRQIMEIFANESEALASVW